MAYGAIKHKRYGRKRVRAALKGRSHKLNVGIWIFRHTGVKRVGYGAEACFYPGGIAAIEPGAYAGKRKVYLNVRRRRLQSNRCARAYGTGPTQAVQRALRALAKKKL